MVISSNVKSFCLFQECCVNEFIEKNKKDFSSRTRRNDMDTEDSFKLTRIPETRAMTLSGSRIKDTG